MSTPMTAPTPRGECLHLAVRFETVTPQQSTSAMTLPMPSFQRTRCLACGAIKLATGEWRNPAPNAPTASEYHAFVPVAREGATIAEDILSTTATMRQSGTFATSSLCWSPAELELLAMFAIAARRGEEAARALLRDVVDAYDWWQVDPVDREAPAEAIQAARAAIAAAQGEK